MAGGEKTNEGEDEVGKTDERREVDALHGLDPREEGGETGFDVVEELRKETFSPKKRVRATVLEEKMLVIQMASPPRRMMPMPMSGTLGRDLSVKRRWGFQRVKKMIKATR